MTDAITDLLNAGRIGVMSPNTNAIGAVALLTCHVERIWRASELQFAIG